MHDGRWYQGVGGTGDRMEKSVWVWVWVAATDVHVHLPTTPSPPFSVHPPSSVLVRLSHLSGVDMVQV